MELTRVTRPINFDSYIGNTEIKNMFRLNIANGTLSNKIILSGRPGIGKSSLAMLIALAAQCEHPQMGNPCMNCPTCKELIERLILNDENCCNVHRFNMSDRKGIDDAREIKSILDYKKPSKYNHTILILEEPQRMSIDAQDYLNVPLEYLQDHIIIIFTTTDLKSMSDAIQSRSNVKTLKVPTVAETTSLLDNVMQARYGKSVPRQLLELVIEYSNGVPRDSIRNLEEVINSGELSINSINSVLGLMNFEYYIDFFGIVYKDINIVARFLAELKLKGVSYMEFVQNLHIFMTDMFKIKFGIPNNRYTKAQVKRCKELFKDIEYKEFMRLQILSTQLAVTDFGNQYQTERLAESLLYEFSLKVNQKFVVDDYFKDTSNDHALAVKAYQEKDLEKFKEKGKKELGTMSEVLTEIAKVSGKDVKVVRTTGEIRQNTNTDIIY